MKRRKWEVLVEQERRFQSPTHQHNRKRMHIIMKLCLFLMSLASVLPADGYQMPKFVLSNLENVGQIEDRIEQAYHEWCVTYKTPPDESRGKVFALNFFQAESYTNKTGRPLELNEFADMTAGEYRRFQEMKERMAVAQETLSVKEIKASTFHTDFHSLLGAVFTNVGPVATIATGDSHLLHRGTEESLANHGNIGTQHSYRSTKSSLQLMQSWIGVRREMQQALETKIKTWENSFQQSLSIAKVEIEQGVYSSQQATLVRNEADEAIFESLRIQKAHVFQRNLLEARLKMDAASRLRVKKDREYALHRDLLTVRLRRKRRERSMLKLSNQVDLLVSATTERLSNLAQAETDARLEKPTVEAVRRKYEFHRQSLKSRLALEKASRAQKHLQKQADTLRATWLREPRNYTAVVSNDVSAALRIYDAAIRTAVEEEDWHGAAVASDLASEHVSQLDDCANVLQDYAALSRDLYAQTKISNQVKSSSWATMKPEKHDFELLEQAISHEVFSQDAVAAAQSSIPFDITGFRP